MNNDNHFDRDFEVPTAPPGEIGGGNGTMMEIPNTGGEVPFPTPPSMDNFSVPDFSDSAVHNLAQIPESQGSISRDSGNSIDQWSALSEDDAAEYLAQQEQENAAEPATPADTGNKGGSNKGILAAMALIGTLALGGMGYLAVNMLGGDSSEPATIEKPLAASDADDSDPMQQDNDADGIEPPAVNEDGKLAVAPVQDSDIPQEPSASDIFAQNDEKAASTPSPAAPAALAASPVAPAPVDSGTSNTASSQDAEVKKADVADKKDTKPAEPEQNPLDKAMAEAQAKPNKEKVVENPTRDENPPETVQSQDPKDAHIRQLEARIAELEMQKECVAPKHFHKEAKKQLKRDKKPVVKKEKADKKQVKKTEVVQRVFPFRVSAISYGQIWIYKNANQTVPYTVGDTLPSGEKILEVDYNSYTVKTNRGSYKVSLNR